MAVGNVDRLSVEEREPARLIGLFATLASGILTILVMLGIAVPDGLDQQVQDVIKTMGAIATIAIPLIQAELTRRKVVPVAKVPGAVEDRPYKPPGTVAASGNVTRV
jgi:hypothetical protein